MKLDAVTLMAGLVALIAGGFAVWQWTAPPPADTDLSTPPVSISLPDARALGATLARLEPVAAPAPRPQAPVTAQRALRLIGIVESDQGRVAVIVADGETLFLRPGETARGVELIALDPSLAVVATDQGERRLALGG